MNKHVPPQTCHHALPDQGRNTEASGDPPWIHSDVLSLCGLDSEKKIKHQLSKKEK